MTGTTGFWGKVPNDARRRDRSHELHAEAKHVVVRSTDPIRKCVHSDKKSFPFFLFFIPVIQTSARVGMDTRLVSMARVEAALLRQTRGQ